MSPLEALKHKALEHKEGINKAIVAPTYLTDFVFGAYSTERSRKAAWSNLVEAASKIGRHAIELNVGVVQINREAEAPTLEYVGGDQVAA